MAFRTWIDPSLEHALDKAKADHHAVKVLIHLRINVFAGVGDDVEVMSKELIVRAIAARRQYRPLEWKLEPEYAAIRVIAAPGFIRYVIGQPEVQSAALDEPFTKARFERARKRIAESLR